MEKRLAIFFVISSAVIISVGVANHRIPQWTSWGFAVGAGARLLVQLYIKKRKSGNH